MEERTCKTCKETFPLTEEFFERSNSGSGYYHFRWECRICRKEYYKYRNALRKARAEKAKEDEWMDKFKNQIFICTKCGQEKTFDEMRKVATDKRMHAWCKKCYNIKSKDYAINSQVKTFEAVLALRQERLKREGENKK